jgi:hypothetical protein
MSKPTLPSPLRQEDYLAIEAAVMETARGRWFLSEYARRNRNADTDTLLGAIDKLEKTLVKERAPGMAVERLKMDLADIAHSIEKTKEEIAQIKHEDDVGTERFVRASSELDAIVSQTESATGEILGAAEKIQEYAWTLREQGADEGHCDSLDEQATNIYMACSFQDLTGQRIQKIVDAMRYVEKRVNAMIEIWGLEEGEVNVDPGGVREDDQRPDAHLLNGPALDGEGVDQSDVDNLFGSVDVESDPAGQDDVDALFDNVDVSEASEIEAEAAVIDASGDLDLDSIDFDAIDQGEEAVAPAVDAMDFDSIEASDEANASDVALDNAAEVEAVIETEIEAEADIFAAPTDETSIDDVTASEPEADIFTASSATEDSAELSEDMFETVAGGDLPENGVTERSENGIEFVETAELDWADSVSLEDLEGADVFASPATAEIEGKAGSEAADVLSEEVDAEFSSFDAGELEDADPEVVSETEISDEALEAVEELAEDVSAEIEDDLGAMEAETSSVDKTDLELPEMLDGDLDMVGVDDNKLVAEMHKVAAEMDRVAAEMGLEGAGKSSSDDAMQQGSLELEPEEPAPLQKRVTDFG